MNIYDLIIDCNPQDEESETRKLNWVSENPQHYYEYINEGRSVVQVPYYKNIGNVPEAYKYIQTLRFLNLDLISPTALKHIVYEQLHEYADKDKIANIINKTTDKTDTKTLYHKKRYVLFNDDLIQRDYCDLRNEQKKIWVNRFIKQRIEDKNTNSVLLYAELNEKWNVIDIRKETGLSRPTIYKILKDNEIEIPQEYNKIDTQIKDLIENIVRYNDIHRIHYITHSMLGKKLNVSAKTIQRFLKYNPEYKLIIDNFNRINKQI
jgi:hypothetical protein